MLKARTTLIGMSLLLLLSGSLSPAWAERGREGGRQAGAQRPQGGQSYQAPRQFQGNPQPRGAPVSRGEQRPERTLSFQGMQPPQRPSRFQSPREPQRGQYFQGGQRAAPPLPSNRGLEQHYFQGGPRQLDRRHAHNRYYPPRGTVFHRLPHNHVLVPYRDTRYYFYGGVWYRPFGSSFVVVSPPVGLTLSLLPPYYTTLWVGGAPYYYADGVYYAWRPVERTYVVVDPPREDEVVSVLPDPEELFIYPKLGQSEQEQADDRYECHRWAVDQTNFDPTLPGGGVPADENLGKREDYQRATRACLEARGYSVR